MACTGITCWLDTDCPEYAECKGIRSEPEDLFWFKNRYECGCGTSWDDEWSCACDDECPSCGRDCSPTESEEIGPRKTGFRED